MQSAGRRGRSLRLLDSDPLIADSVNIIPCSQRADFLARVAPAFQRRPDYDKVYPPSYVRTYVTFAVIVCLLSSLVGRVMAPSPMPFGCPISQGIGR